MWHHEEGLQAGTVVHILPPDRVVVVLCLFNARALASSYGLGIKNSPAASCRVQLVGYVQVEDEGKLPNSDEQVVSWQSNSL